jgi:hypothetical protein
MSELKFKEKPNSLYTSFNKNETRKPTKYYLDKKHNGKMKKRKTHQEIVCVLFLLNMSILSSLVF